MLAAPVIYIVKLWQYSFIRKQFMCQAGNLITKADISWLPSIAITARHEPC